MTSVCFPAHHIPSEKGFTLKANLLHRVDPVPEGKQNYFDRIALPENSSFSIKKVRIFRV